MNFPGRVASGGLIFVGFLWLLSLFLNPSNWGNRTANQLNSTTANPAGTQKFAVPNAQPPLANSTDRTIEQQKATANNSAAANNRVTAVPQTVDTPNQAATPAPTFEPSPAPVAATPAPTPVATPAPTVVPEPVRAGW